MKKAYYSPETKIMKVVAQPLLFAASNGDGTLDGGGSRGNLGTNDNVLSRRRGGNWDDED